MDIRFMYEYAPRETQALPLPELAEFVLVHEDCPSNVECSVMFIDDDAMAQMNSTYRGIDGPTDVLSFECDGLDDGFDDCFDGESEDGFNDENDDFEFEEYAEAEDGEAIEGAFFFEDESESEDIFLLGDIAIAPDVAARQCEIYGTTFEGEMSLLLVHGLLHLCGYDHMVEEDAVVMEQREAELLRLWCEQSGGTRDVADFGRVDKEASIESLRR